MVYGRLISLLRFETMAPNKQPVTGTKPRNAMPDRQGDRLARISAALLRAAGASEAEADAVATASRSRMPHGKIARFGA